MRKCVPIHLAGYESVLDFVGRIFAVPHWPDLGVPQGFKAMTVMTLEDRSYLRKETQRDSECFQPIHLL